MKEIIRKLIDQGWPGYLAIAFLIILAPIIIPAVFIVIFIFILLLPVIRIGAGLFMLVASCLVIKFMYQGEWHSAAIAFAVTLACLIVSGVTEKIADVTGFDGSGSGGSYPPWYY